MSTEFIHHKLMKYIMWKFTHHKPLKYTMWILPLKDVRVGFYVYFYTVLSYNLKAICSFPPFCYPTSWDPLAMHCWMSAIHIAIGGVTGGVISTTSHHVDKQLQCHRCQYSNFKPWLPYLSWSCHQSDNQASCSAHRSYHVPCIMPYSFLNWSTLTGKCNTEFYLAENN